MLIFLCFVSFNLLLKLKHIIYKHKYIIYIYIYIYDTVIIEGCDYRDCTVVVKVKKMRRKNNISCQYE